MDHGMREAIRDAMGAHGAWKLRLKTAVMTGRGDITAAHARCDDRCAFGRWLYGPDLGEDLKRSKPYQVVRRLHAEFHESAGAILAAAEQGDSVTAEAILADDFDTRSEVLKRALVKWLGELTQAAVTPPRG